MCEFVSWIEEGGKVFFLTGNQVFHTAKGHKLQAHCGSRDDLGGHGAIRLYFGLPTAFGENKECDDFSTPANFPPEIAEAIKSGAMRSMDIAPALLTQPAMAEYQRAVEPAWAEYRRIEGAAQAEYQRAVEPALADYERVKEPTLAEYQRVKESALAEYQRVTQAAMAEYERAEGQIFWALFACVKNRIEAWR